MTDTSRTAPATEERIDAAGLDSFPASDPPGWWSGPARAPEDTDTDADAGDEPARP